MHRTIVALAVVLLVAAQARAEVKTKTVEYKAGDATMKGYIAWDDKIEGKRPGVMVVHEWWGLNEDAKNRAKMLAELGYVGFCADMYGDGKTTEHPKEAGEMAGMVRKNAKLWIERSLAGLDQLKAHDQTDGTKLGAIGYCFGGSTVQMMAFHGTPGLKAVVSFHGALVVPTEDQVKKTKAKILICHGADDAFIKEETIKEFKAALDKGKVDYQFESYPGAVHSFTVVDADKKGVKGIAYNKAADEKSWSSMQKLFKEAFAK